MIYQSGDDWLKSDTKRVLLFGMSGLGKTHVSNMLRESGDWFHYSVDYRIGTRYMGEHIVDNFKREAMKNPFLNDLLRTDSIYIASNITFDNLAPLSTYLGKPGDPAKGGLPFDEYMKRQEQHRVAEVASLKDGAHFINRAHDIYGYDNFVCDSGGSICEVVNPDDPNDAVLKSLSENLLLVGIQGSAEHTAELTRRFDKSPKPMCYQAEFLNRVWAEYLAEHNVTQAQVDPDAFVRWAYGQALAHRKPLYDAMAKNWGLSVSADDIAAATTPDAFNALIAQALEKASL
ncbi:MAG: ATPase [Marinosulfonomonas sp.]|nr:ATPase [Marinosulfonomonas sp.]